VELAGSSTIVSPFRKIRYPVSSEALSAQVTVKFSVPTPQEKFHSTIPGWRGGALVAVDGGVTLATAQ
jgi:hypothetical protein